MRTPLLQTLFEACALVLLLESCRPYDPALLSSRGTTPSDSGVAPAKDSGAACVPSPELCNRIDDDCDGTIDEETQTLCAAVIVNAESDCVAFGMTASCVLLSCKPGFDDCDGNPANGCEPYCNCHDCPDAGPHIGPEADAGEGADAGESGEDAGTGADASVL
jgi:hypothetical protein